MNTSEYDTLNKFLIIFNVLAFMCWLAAVVVFIIGVVTCVNAVINTPAYDDAYERGMTEDDKNQFTYLEIKELNEITPISEDLPDDTSGILVVLYKYGADYCNAIYEDLADAIASYENSYVGTSFNLYFYYVASSTEDGQSLIEETGATQVPIIIYFYNEPTEDGETVKWLPLSVIDGSGNISLDTDALWEMIELQESGA